ncbi:hypothetical protein MGN70_007072 [Eutypa lata]|nr:hypothetical protein MGN70_007072 [Eutypa lata]
MEDWELVSRKLRGEYGTSVGFSSSYLLSNVQPRVVHREPKEELAVLSRYSCFRKPSATAASAWSFSRVSDTIPALISPPKPDWTENAVGDLLDSGIKDGWKKVKAGMRLLADGSLPLGPARSSYAAGSLSIEWGRVARGQLAVAKSRTPVPNNTSRPDVVRTLTPIAFLLAATASASRLEERSASAPASIPVSRATGLEPSGYVTSGSTDSTRLCSCASIVDRVRPSLDRHRSQQYGRFRGRSFGLCDRRRTAILLPGIGLEPSG